MRILFICRLIRHSRSTVADNCGAEVSTRSHGKGQPHTRRDRRTQRQRHTHTHTQRQTHVSTVNDGTDICRDRNNHKETDAGMNRYRRMQGQTPERTDIRKKSNTHEVTDTRRDRHITHVGTDTRNDRQTY